VIAFGTPVSEPDAYRRYAEQGIRAVAEADSAVYAFSAVGTAARIGNLLLDAAAAHGDLEALVLVHPHAEIADARFCAKVRAALADTEVAVAGCAGAAGVRGLAWWEGRVHAGEVLHAYTQNGGGVLPAYSWVDREPPPAEVDAVDGFLLVLSPWAVRNLRFDEDLWLGPGFDVDYCLRARRAGRKVMAVDLRTILHRSLEPIEAPEVFTVAGVQLAEKWFAGGDVDWKARARRAEAEREASKAVGYFRAVAAEERVDALERALAEATSGPGWRLTAPLRRLNARRRARARSRRS